MTIFNGKDFAKKIEEQLVLKSVELEKVGITPKLAIFYIGENEASEKYIELKQSAGRRIGIDVDLYKVYYRKDPNQIIQLIKFLDSDPMVHGVMIQLPMPKAKLEYKEKFFNAISVEKDVDGHRKDSLFEPATVKAIIKIIEEAKVIKEMKVLVVGSKGEVGSRLMTGLEKRGYKALGYDKKDHRGAQKQKEALVLATKEADVIVSVTGIAGLISTDMVEKDVIIIDVGSPKPEVDFENIKEKAAFITPVPGGVGPVTVVSLLENVIEAAARNIK